MTDPTITLRNRRYRRRQKERGMAQVRVFVPAGSEEKIRKLAEKLRKQAPASG
jgi:hypothetical protein